MTKKLIAVLALFSTVVTASAQIDPVWWRIVNGRGGGTVIKGAGPCGSPTCIVDPEVGAVGGIALGHFSDCPCHFADGHYHGTLFGIEDPAPNACGWGCVYEIPYSRANALTELYGRIDDIGRNFDPDLADKLDSIVGMMEDAAADECYSVVDALANAFGDELQAYSKTRDIPRASMVSCAASRNSWKLLTTNGTSHTSAFRPSLCTR
jgi:hypothetical protein